MADADFSKQQQIFLNYSSQWIGPNKRYSRLPSLAIFLISLKISLKIKI